MTARKYIVKRLAAGYCRNCGKRKVKLDCTNCVHCLSEKAKTKASTKGRWACQKCLDQRKESSRKYRQRQKENPVYKESDLTYLSLWRHVKGGLYIVLGVATCSSNGERDGKERSVIYWSITYQALRYRDITEFLDGRFIPATIVGSNTQQFPCCPGGAGPYATSQEARD